MRDVHQRGKFITIEGTEGVGKSTNMDFIGNWLTTRKIQCVSTREPGGTPLAEEIRELLLVSRDELISLNTELLLMFASRAQHIKEFIEPNLSKGVWVICDRFTDATFAYQGGGRGIPDGVIEQLEFIVQGALHPDLTFIFDIPVPQGLKRAHRRSKPDRFESEQIDFFERVRQSYLERVQINPDRYRIIDASQSITQVQTLLERELADFTEKLK